MLNLLYIILIFLSLPYYYIFSSDENITLTSDSHITKTIKDLSEKKQEEISQQQLALTQTSMTIGNNTQHISPLSHSIPIHLQSTHQQNTDKQELMRTRSLSHITIKSTLPDSTVQPSQRGHRRMRSSSDSDLSKRLSIQESCITENIEFEDNNPILLLQKSKSELLDLRTMWETLIINFEQSLEDIELKIHMIKPIIHESTLAKLLPEQHRQEARLKAIAKQAGQNIEIQNQCVIPILLALQYMKDRTQKGNITFQQAIVQIHERIQKRS